LIVRPTDEKKARNPELSAVARHQISIIMDTQKRSEARFIGIIPVPQRHETTLYVYMIYEGSMTVLLGLHVLGLSLMPAWASAALPFPVNIESFALLSPMFPAAIFCGEKMVQVGATEIAKGLEGLGFMK